LGYDAEFGARPLRRIIQHKVEDPLSDKVLSGEFQNGDTILVTLNPDKEIMLERKNEREVEPEAEAAPVV
jgi:ATP-dependent Clp protease ATP-binding subunit ClpA